MPKMDRSQGSVFLFFSVNKFVYCDYINTYMHPSPSPSSLGVNISGSCAKEACDKIKAHSMPVRVIHKFILYPVWHQIQVVMVFLLSEGWSVSMTVYVEATCPPADMCRAIHHSDIYLTPFQVYKLSELS